MEASSKSGKHIELREEHSDDKNSPSQIFSVPGSQIINTMKSRRNRRIIMFAGILIILLASVFIFFSEPKVKQIEKQPKQQPEQTGTPKQYYKQRTRTQLEALLLVQYIIDHPHINRITVIDGLESKPLSLFFKFELEKNKNLKLKGLNDLQESQDQTLIQKFFEDGQLLVVNNTLEYLSDLQLDIFFANIIPKFKYTVIISQTTDSLTRKQFKKKAQRPINVGRETDLSKQIKDLNKQLINEQIKGDKVWKVYLLSKDKLDE